MPLPIACKKEILKAIYPKCWICRLPFADHPHLQRTIDHYLPRSKGGGNSLDNLRYAHHFCNQLRRNALGNPSKGFRANCYAHNLKVLKKLAAMSAGQQLNQPNDVAGFESSIEPTAPSLVGEGGQS
jgi:hypothetical protein